MTASLKTPRSPYDQVGGLTYLGRCIDKIRLKEAGQLRPDFYELMGKGYDARIMSYLELDYEKFAEFVLTGATDEQCWDYCVQHGRAMNDQLTLIWNDFASKRGWKDSASELLAKFKAESGLSSRDDLVTLYEYWEVDEGRKE
jgi:gluconokinase